MSNYEGWCLPRCLVDDGGDGSIGVNGTTLEALSHIDVPLDVVCVLGGYRTGKSYLMNWLAHATTSASSRPNAGSYSLSHCTRFT